MFTTPKARVIFLVFGILVMTPAEMNQVKIKGFTVPVDVYCGS
jgi:hypothetical protein